MSTYQVINLKDQPYATYCQAFDCSKITAKFDYAVCSSLYLLYANITGVYLTVSNSTNVYGPVNIKDSLIIAKTGTVSTTAWSNIVTGLGTLFLTEFVVGDIVSINSLVYEIYRIDSNTSMLLTSIAQATVAGTPIRKISFTYDITPVMLGYSTSTTIPEDNYRFTLEVVYSPSYNGGQTITDEVDVAIYCDKYCCVYEELADLADICDECLDQDEIKRITNTLLMWGLLESYKGAAGCGDFVSQEELKSRLDRFCNYKPCTNC